MKKHVFLMSAFMVSLAWWGPSDLRAEDGSLIVTMSVKGNRRVLGVQIREIMKLKVNAHLDPRAASEDVKALYATGDFSDVFLSAREVEGGVELIVTVTENPLVSKITFQGTKRDAKDLMDKIPLKEKQVFNALKLKLSEKALLDYFEKEGWYGSKVESMTTEVSPYEVKASFIIDEGQHLTVEKVNIVCRAFSSDRLKGEMKTSEGGLLGGGTFNPTVFKEDLERLEAFCKEEGHAEARVVAHKVDINAVKQKVVITVEIDEGPLYKVGTIDLRLEESDPETRAKLLDSLSTRSGKRFNPKALDEDISVIRRYYGNQGYMYSNVVPALAFQREMGLVDMTLNVRRGPESFIEEIIIQGNLDTKDKVIRRELEIQPNDRVDLSKILRSREKVWNLGFFEEPPNFDLLPGTKDGYRKLIFIVKERQTTGEVNLGAGYSALDGFTGTFGLTKHNFGGNGQRISVSAEYGGFRQAYDISFFEPWLFDTDTSFNINTFYSRRAFFSDYKELTYGGSLRFGHSLDKEKFWRLWTSYRYAFTEIYDVVSTASREIQNSAGARTVSSVPMELVFDSRDSIFFNTTKGNRFSLGLEVAGLGGNLFFTRYVFDGSWFQETLPLWTIALHTRVGYVTGYGDTPNVPFFERFFLGGTDSIRGYAERGVGPNDGTGFATGGRLSWVMNLEYRVPIIERVFYWVSFFDVGGLWDKADLARPEDLASGAGFGLRAVIPNTTLIIRLDYGFGFNPAYGGSSGGRPHFNFGSIF